MARGTRKRRNGRRASSPSLEALAALVVFVGGFEICPTVHQILHSNLPSHDHEGAGATHGLHDDHVDRHHHGDHEHGRDAEGDHVHGHHEREGSEGVASRRLLAHAVMLVRRQERGREPAHHVEGSDQGERATNDSPRYEIAIERDPKHRGHGHDSVAHRGVIFVSPASPMPVVPLAGVIARLTTFSSPVRRLRVHTGVSVARGPPRV